MGILTWFERRLFTGEVLKDYGPVAEESQALGRRRTGVLLCRRSGRLEIVIRSSARAFASASVNYVRIPVTVGSLETLERAIADARSESEGRRRR